MFWVVEDAVVVWWLLIGGHWFILAVVSFIEMSFKVVVG